MKGRFIVLEGGEGAGKTTVASFLQKTFPAEKLLVTQAGGSPFGQKLKALLVSDEAASSIPESRFSLAWAAHVDHIRQIITPTVSKGVHIVSDRFDASTFAYQVWGEEALHLTDLFWQLRKNFLRGTVPDLYIFLDVGTREGFAHLRKVRKVLDHIEKRPLAFHERVREGYREFFKQMPHVVVDANRPLEEVQKEVLAIIKKHL